LADLFAGLAGRQRTSRGPGPIPGADYEAGVRLSFDQAYAGTEIELDLIAVEYDEQGSPKRVPHRLKVRIPPGVVDGQKLRVQGKGGKGLRGGRDSGLGHECRDADACRNRLAQSAARQPCGSKAPA